MIVTILSFVRTSREGEVRCEWIDEGVDPELVRRDRRFLEGGLHVCIGKQVAVSFDHWTDVDVLWAYLLSGIEALARRQRWSTGYPDCSTELAFEPVAYGRRDVVRLRVRDVEAVVERESLLRELVLAAGTFYEHAPRLHPGTANDGDRARRLIASLREEGLCPPPAAMDVQWLITKDDPALDTSTWKTMAHVGRTFGGVSLTPERYLATETAYAETIVRFMRDSGVETLRVQDHEPFAEYEVTPELVSLREGQTLEPDDVIRACRVGLREHAWLRLVAPGFEVEFGWNFYVYVRTQRPCSGARKHARTLGLFVTEVTP
jgi:hypothetical protein